VRIAARGKLHIETVASGVVPQLKDTVAHMFRLDEDLSGFYELVREDDLAWVVLGAGRMLRAPTVFEDVVKTTNTFIRTNRGVS
jgi:3-methyladenine DNA glycosylase/8-oxoguanine DNA glycosylase